MAKKRIATPKTRVLELRLGNFGNFTEFELQCGGNLTEIRGRNAAGKTTLINALATALGGGYPADLVRKGSEEAELVLVLEQDGRRIEETKTIKASGSGTVKLRDLERGEIRAPQSFLAELCDSLALNPMPLLEADPKSRTKLLLEAFEFELDLDAAAEAIGIPREEWPPTLGGKHPLVVLDTLHQQRYGERTEVNRRLREKKDLVTELRRSLPKAGEIDLEAPAKLEAARTRREELRVRIAGAEDQAEIARAEARSEVNEAVSQMRASAEADYQKALAEIQAKRDKALAKAQAHKDEEWARIEAEFEEAVSAARGKQPEVDAISDEIAGLEAAAERVASTKTNRELIDRQAADADELESKTRELSANLDALEAMKRQLLDDLPIKGLSVEDGVITVDGVPFDRLNTQKQLDVWARVVNLRAKPLKLILVDGLERFDPERFEEFVKWAESEDLQLIYSRVAEGPLEVEADPPPLAERRQREYEARVAGRSLTSEERKEIAEGYAGKKAKR